MKNTLSFIWRIAINSVPLHPFINQLDEGAIRRDGAVTLHAGSRCPMESTIGPNLVSEEARWLQWMLDAEIAYLSILLTKSS
jgi:hypothetical protein